MNLVKNRIWIKFGLFLVNFIAPDGSNTLVQLSLS